MSSENYKVGDKVFAKMRGYRPWPARIEDIISDHVDIRYKVYFYGNGSTGVVKHAQICSFVENKMRLGKCGKHNTFIKAMKQIESELTKELEDFKELEIGKELDSSDLSVPETSLSSAGNAETSLLSEGVTKKTKLNNSLPLPAKLDTSSTERTDLKNPFLPENLTQDPEQETASRIEESVNESTEAQEESGNETCLKPPTLISFTETSDGLVSPLAYINTDYTVTFNKRTYNIPIHINKPEFHILKEETIWYANMVNYASYLKQKVEVGDIPPESVDSYMMDWSLSIAKEYQEHCNMKIANATAQFILTEEKLISTNYSFRKALVDTTLCNLDMQLGTCLQILKSLADIKLTRLLLVRNPDFVLNIKHARESFINNLLKDEKMEDQVKRKIKTFYLRVEQIYFKFNTLFSVPSRMTFWQVYDLERSAYELEKESNSFEDLVAEDILYESSKNINESSSKVNIL